MKIIIAITLMLAAYTEVSTMSYHDAVQQANHCADMVQAGVWPEEVCK